MDAIAAVIRQQSDWSPDTPVNIRKNIIEIYGESVEIAAVGTNATAVSQMMKACAERVASGENARVIMLFLCCTRQYFQFNFTQQSIFCNRQIVVHL